MNIERELKGGRTAEDLLKEFKESLAAAEKKIAEDEEKAAKISKAREELVDAIANYLYFVEGTETSEEDKKSVIEVLKMAEEDSKKGLYKFKFKL